MDVPEIATGRFETKTFEWLKGRKSLLWLSERDGWRHAYSVPRYGDKRTLLTSGDWDVVSIVGVDAESRWLYFIASPGSAVDRYLYRAQSMPQVLRRERDERLGRCSNSVPSGVG